MKLLRYFALFILFLFCLSIWSGMVRHAAIGGDQLGSMGKPVSYIAEFPSAVKDTYDALMASPETYLSIPEKDRKGVNKMDYDLLATNAHWNSAEKRWEIDLFNFRNNDILHTWILKESDFTREKYKSFSNVRPKHTLMLNDRSIIVSMYGSNNLSRYNERSEVIWKNNELRTHHALNADYEGNIWVCTNEDEPESNKGIENFDGKIVIFRDNNISKYDVNTGELLFNKPVSELLFDNGLEHLLFHSVEMQWDPIHLNDIQPVLEDGEYWKKGDLFLSLRNNSTILLYRPSTNKVIWYRSHHPLLHQHDIDVLNDHEISIFNNNHVNNDFRLGSGTDDYSSTYDLKERENPYSQMLVYNFQTDSFSTRFSDQFNDFEIGTPTEGLLEVIPNGDLLVESQNNGLVYIINENGLVMKKAYPTEQEGKFHMTNWIRIYPSK